MGSVGDLISAAVSAQDGIRRGRPRADTVRDLISAGEHSSSRIRCNVCNRVFPREKSLQAHKRTHTGEWGRELGAHPQKQEENPPKYPRRRFWAIRARAKRSRCLPPAPCAGGLSSGQPGAPCPASPPRLASRMQFSCGGRGPAARGWTAAVGRPGGVGYSLRSGLRR